MSDTLDKEETQVHPDSGVSTNEGQQTSITSTPVPTTTDGVAAQSQQTRESGDAGPVDQEVEKDAGQEDQNNAVAATSEEEEVNASTARQNQVEHQDTANTADDNEVEQPANQNIINLEEHGLNLDDEEGFDPATLANLAALSRIANEEGDEDGEGEDNNQDQNRDQDQDQQDNDALEVHSPRHDGPLTREQVQEFVNNLSHQKSQDKENEDENDKNKDRDEEERDQREDEDPEIEEKQDDKLKEIDQNDESKNKNKNKDRKQADEEYEDENEKNDIGSGAKQKRKRNRTVLSCTETYVSFPIVQHTIKLTDISSPILSHIEHCDRNIPCSRCIKRGVPGMCRMEHPVLPQRKKRKVQDDEDINYELGLRVQALESLLRSGSLMDADQASAAAKETIMHATRAANAGSQDANNALAQLTQSVAVSGGIGGLSQDAQSSLLLDVLQQLTAASMGRPLDQNGAAEGSNRRGLEVWSAIPTASQETSVAIASAYENDEVGVKINLSLPGFREDNGKIFIPPTVRYVEKNLRNENILAREALPIEGYSPFLDAGTKFAYGSESQAYRHRRIASIQAFSLTGALRLAATFLSRFPPVPGTKSVFVPSPTADEDTTALQDSGLEIRSFRFLDYKTGGVDWESLREDLQDAPPKSVVLIQVSGSMPSGAELTTNQWRLLAALLQERELIPLVMMAYQGLSTGDTNRDAQALRFMVHEGLPVVLVQSFDAMMGLYGDSPSIVSIVTQNAEDRDRVDSQLRSVARGMWFHPSPWGAQVAHQILSDAKLYPAWLAEIKAMSDRLRSVREKLYDLLANKLKTPGSWIHLKRASGMYCTALLPPSQVDALTSKRHVHLLPDGCFNLGCLNATKIDILARAIDNVVREGIKEMEEQQAQRLAMELALAAAKEQQAREEAEALELAAQALREEDTLLMERSIANAIERQRIAEMEEERDRQTDEKQREIDRRAAERAEIAKQAEAILASLQPPNHNGGGVGH
ncbi:hypothetical protein L486_01602 [Kwoniella mangroviensis CBS 10435]|uniref:Aminotransferase class I/classII large domain-containing protein n=1 Tax=Kwoniella mangroviensis CBS 10435 TaxID=1331196 RepID=A0A1B9J2C0_9TREE|nr:uncharacterized protein I203_03732 [Kwoniella mangroviensis CBS 8507]OCF61937.1 hypothetical protein L486_01602 [Kwoniella mangroviensis CBS 10435]OCF67049.1 hypothetical protein I203_03732 [Kwoniella mangroviensis CBS 8507]OCF77956.1 hypothetical protein I204_01961 [Kwoniella mangroviensis CBS 8886]